VSYLYLFYLSLSFVKIEKLKALMAVLAILRAITFRHITSSPNELQGDKKEMVHTHHFKGKPRLAGCPLNSPTPFILGLGIHLGQA